MLLFSTDPIVFVPKFDSVKKKTTGKHVIIVKKYCHNPTNMASEIHKQITSVLFPDLMPLSLESLKTYKLEKNFVDLKNIGNLNKKKIRK
jgi:hypothetical protein